MDTATRQALLETDSVGDKLRKLVDVVQDLVIVQMLDVMDTTVLDQFRANGEGAVDPAGYHWAFGSILALQIVAVLWYLRPTRSN
jgi:DNA-directed RNA polymerase beta' subunit